MSKKMWKNFAKFRLLMWKNWKLQLRHPVQTIFEMLVPVFFCVILVLVRSLVDTTIVEETHYQPYSPLATIGMLESYHFAYSPNTSEQINDLMANINLYIKPPIPPEEPEFTFIGFLTAIDLENYLIASPEKQKVGIVFPDNYADLPDLPAKVNFTLRFPSELQSGYYPGGVAVDTWQTNQLFPNFFFPGPRDRFRENTASPSYFYEEFLRLQGIVSLEIIKLKLHITDGSILPSVLMQRFPFPAFLEDFLMSVMTNFISLIIVLAFEYTGISIIKIITAEKEKQLKESMKIMGLPGWLHWTAWFTKSFLFMLVAIILMTILFKVSAWYDDHIPAVFPETDGFLLFIFLTLFVIATITLCFAISVFFTKGTK